MLDFPKALSAIADADSRLEQIANQQKITNGLLALLVLANDMSAIAVNNVLVTPGERAQLIALVRTAFNDRPITVNDDGTVNE